MASMRVTGERQGSSFGALFLVGAALSIVVAAIGGLAAQLPASFALARVVAELWCIAVLLSCAAACPVVTRANVALALLPAALLLGLYVCDASAGSPAVLALCTLAVLLLGSLVGGYIGGLLEFPGMLMVVAYVAALGDCFSVFHPRGLTATVLQHPKVLAFVSLSFPILGTDQVAPLVGIGDVAFVCVFAVGAKRVGLSAGRSLLALAAALACVVLSVEFAAVPLPAVPFMGAAMVLAHPETRRLPPSQARRIGLNLAAVTALLGVLWLSGQAPDGPAPESLSSAPKTK